MVQFLGVDEKNPQRAELRLPFQALLPGRYSAPGNLSCSSACGTVI